MLNKTYAGSSPSMATAASILSRENTQDRDVLHASLLHFLRREGHIDVSRLEQKLMQELWPIVNSPFGKPEDRTPEKKRSMVLLLKLRIALLEAQFPSVRTDKNEAELIKARLSQFSSWKAPLSCELTAEMLKDTRPISEQELEKIKDLARKLRTEHALQGKSVPILEAWWLYGSQSATNWLRIVMEKPASKTRANWGPEEPEDMRRSSIEESYAVRYSAQQLRALLHEPR